MSVITTTGDGNVATTGDVQIIKTHINLNYSGLRSTRAQQLEKGIWFNIGDPIQTFTGREQQILDLHEHIQNNRPSEGGITVLSQTSVITGLGGIGKTETVRMYINKYQNHYKHIIWVDAEKYSVAEAQFKELAEQLFGNSKFKNFKYLIQRVYETLCQTSNMVLVVFDNAESMDETDGIRVFLPKSRSSLKPSCEKPAILVTSRSQNWPEQKVIKLDVWTEDESIKFILQQHPLIVSKIEENRQSALELAELFGHFPLAIQTAVAIIREQLERNNYSNIKTYTISDLIKDYNTGRGIALNKSFAPSKKTMMTLWKITFDKILKQQHGELALEVLFTISYLSPTCIPKDMLSYIFKQQSHDFSCAIKLLTTYCLITNYDKYFTVHRLIQDVSIEHLKQTNNKTPQISQSSEDIKYPNENLIISKITKKIQEYLSSITTESSLYSDVADNLIYICNNILDSLKTKKHVRFILSAVDKIKDIRMQEALRILKKTLIQHEKHQTSIHTLALKIDTRIAYLLQRKGNCDAALTMYRQVLQEQEKVVGVNHLSTLMIKHNIAYVLTLQGQNEAALRMYMQVLDEQKKSLGANHLSTLTTKHNIADVLASLEQYEPALKLYTQVLYETEKSLGVNHSLTLATKRNLSLLRKTQGWTSSLTTLSSGEFQDRCILM